MENFYFHSFGYFPNGYLKVLHLVTPEIYFLTKVIDDDSASFFDTRLNSWSQDIFSRILSIS